MDNFLLLHKSSLPANFLLLKNPLHYTTVMQRTYFLTRGSTSLALCANDDLPEPLFRCNVSGRTGLGSLRVSFQMFPAKMLAPLGISLWYVPHSTLLFNVLSFLIVRHTMLSDSITPCYTRILCHASQKVKYFFIMRSFHSIFYTSCHFRMDKGRLDIPSYPYELW